MVSDGAHTANLALLGQLRGGRLPSGDGFNSLSSQLHLYYKIHPSMYYHENNYVISSNSGQVNMKIPFAMPAHVLTLALAGAIGVTVSGRYR
jgi:hypothetical protein